MNLASQTVLEGLNSCLDHRGSVYVPDIGRTFTKHPDFRLFAAQNPQHQGGARKGLPKSLLNRFIKVYVAELQDADIRVICEQLYRPEPRRRRWWTTPPFVRRGYRPRGRRAWIG